MLLKSITMTNFRCYAGETTIEFPRAPGLYHVFGENMVNPSLGSNAVGKSTVCDALCWVHYDKLANGTRGPAVRSWQPARRKQTSVEVVYILTDDTLLRIKRTHSPNTLRLRIGEESWRDVTQEDVVGIIKQPYETYLYTTVISQGGKTYLEMRPSDCSKLFSTVLDLPLEVWDSCVARARREFDNADRAVHNVQVSLARVEGSIATLLATDYSARSRDWAEDKARRLEGAAAELSQMRHALGQMEATDNLEEALAQAQAEEAAQELELAELRTYARETEELHIALTDEHARKSRDVTFVKADIDKIVNNAETICSQCYQPVSSQVLENKRRELEAQLQVLSKELNESVAARQEVISMRSELRVKETAITKAKSRAGEESQVLSRKIAQAERAKQSAMLKITAQQKVISAIEAEQDPYAQLRQERVTSLVTLEAEQVRHQQAVHEAETAREGYQYWVTAFKEMKLQVLQAVLLHLELETNNYLGQLGLSSDWSVKFNLERELASGDLKKELTVLISSGSNPKPVAWQDWCGGERQRIKVAGILGLSRLIRALSSLEPGIEFWDEPTTGMSGQGIQHLMELLKRRAREEGRAIMLIDHRDLPSQHFDGILTCKNREVDNHDYIETYTEHTYEAA